MTRGNRCRHFINIAAIILLAWVAYGSCLSFNFVWDDFGLIVHNDQIQAQSTWYQLFTQDFWTLSENVKDASRNFYRPLISLSYGIDYKIWGLNPFGFHLTNMIAHSLAVVMVYILAVLLLKKRLPAFVCTLVWAVHPSHVENVCWISGRTDVLCAVFFLLSLILFRWWMLINKGNLLLPFFIVLSYLAALFSKETAVVFPLVCAADVYFLGGGYEALKRKRPFLLFLCLMTVCYLFVRFSILGEVIGPAAYGTIWQKMISIPMVLAKYLGLLLTIIPVDAHHNDKLLETVFSNGFLIGVLAGFLFLACLVILWRNAKRRELFAASLFLLMLAPVFHLGSFGDVIFADRFLYIPSIGFFLLVTMIVSNGMPVLRKLSGIAAPGLGVVAVMYVMLITSYTRFSTQYWRDGTVLFYRAAQTSPDSAYVYFNLGQSLMHQGAYYKAQESYGKALALQPDYGDAYVNISAALNKIGEHREAIKYLNQAVAMQVLPHVTYATLGDAYVGLNEPDRAMQFYRLAILARDTSRARNNLGLCLLRQDQLESAAHHFAVALEMSPVPYTFNNLAKLELERNEPSKALSFLSQAMSFKHRELPVDLLTDIYYNMARALFLTGQSATSGEYAEKALHLIAEGKGPASLNAPLVELLNDITASSLINN